jgi:AGZA family xanthine/uracil permease-like MFS transporter
MWERLFSLKAQGVTVRTEVLAGITTFLTMAYIIFVQPAVLSGSMFGIDTGMDFYAVTTATCLAAATATVVMGLLARYPIALAPGMGQNFLFTLGLIPAAAATIAQEGWQTEPWQVALGVIFVAGVLFLLLSVLGVRERIMNAVSPSMKNAIAVGIGLFIAFVGMKNAGLIVTAATIVPTSDGPAIAPGTLVELNPNFASPDLLVFFAGLVTIGVLHTLRVRGAILWGILAAAALAVAMRLVIPLLPAAVASHEVVANSQLMTQFKLIHAVPAEAWNPLYAIQALGATALKMDIIRALFPAMIPYVVLFLFMDVFDTIGTLIGVTQEAGLIKDNKLPRAGRAMLADATGTVVGAAMGTSTVTSYIESAAGVEQGGRTGLTALVVAGCFVAALMLAPVIAMIGSLPAVTAPALVIVGAMMIRNVVHITWSDYSESIPAFLTIVGIPLCFNIGDGLALGFIAYPIIKLLSGRWRQVSWLMAILALVLIAYFLFIRTRVG